MKPVLSLTLILGLVVSALPLPLTAQERAESVGPLAAAVGREVARLAGTGEFATPVTMPAQTGGNADLSDWSRVRTLAPGTEVVVTVTGSQPGSRYFVRADEFELAVLNLTDPAIPRAAARLLLETVARRPESFAVPGGRDTFERDGVRIELGGVFVAGRQVGSLDRLIERVGRAEVSDVRRAIPRRSIARRVTWALGGYFAGAMAGGLVGGGIDCSIGGCESLPRGAFIGLVSGAVGGAIVGYRWGSRVPSPRPEDVIYRTP